MILVEGLHFTSLIHVGNSETSQSNSTVSTNVPAWFILLSGPGTLVKQTQDIASEIVGHELSLLCSDYASPSSGALTLTPCDPMRSMLSYRFDSEIVYSNSMSSASGTVSQVAFQPHLLSGEEIQFKCDSVIFGESKEAGNLFITNFCIILFYKNGDHTEIPLTAVSALMVKGNGILICTKDIRSIEITVRDLSHHRDIISILTGKHPVIKSLSWCYPSSPRMCFAFYSTECIDGHLWNIYSVSAEFARLGFCPFEWRICTLNSSYSLCSTYPKQFIVPSGINDDELKKVAAFRSKARIPVVCWINSVTGATLSRSAQPIIGLFSKKCNEDQKLLHELLQLNYIFQQSGGDHKLHVMDARANIAAAANSLSGKGGTEGADSYPFCSFTFLGIGNIHALRDSFYKLCNLCVTSTHSALQTPNWLAALHQTQWLHHVHKVLSSAVLIADHVRKGKSVLTHCSDGWDRTAQLVSLAQIMLDPYFRTLRGFCILIEKEWICAGHKFMDRTAFGKELPIGGETSKDYHEFSPVFHLFLDCVWQITQQFPTAFEFNGSLLILLSDSAYSCRFGNFLFNNDKDRQEAAASRPGPHSLPSIWAHVTAHGQDYTNGQYQRPHPHSTTPLVLLPSASPLVLHLWPDYYLRWHNDVGGFLRLPSHRLSPTSQSPVYSTD
ncbi:Myotubularin 1 [Pelomyxa schiedti]|nr:Myotubularin 1 [Pelomyxa schiedti]